MRNFLRSNGELFQRLESVEKRQIAYEIKTDYKFDPQQSKNLNAILRNVGCMRGYADKIIASAAKIDHKSLERIKAFGADSPHPPRRKI